MTVIEHTRVTGLDRIQDVTVAFVDIVGFTDLSRRLSLVRLGAITDRLEHAAIEAARPPASFVKLVGDAAMLVGNGSQPIVEAVVELLELAERDPRMPRLHAGAASGEALHRDGDWLGVPVNVASHLTTEAAPGELLAVRAVADASASCFNWRHLGARTITGVSVPIELAVLACAPVTAIHAARR